MAQDTNTTGSSTDDHGHHEDGSHEIAGFRVGVNPIPFSVILVFCFIFFIAILSWVPTYGF